MLCVTWGIRVRVRVRVGLGYVDVHCVTWGISGNKSVKG